MATLYFPEVIQHNFALKSYTHSLEWEKLPRELKPHSSYVNLPFYTFFSKNIFWKNSEAQTVKRLRTI